MHIAPVVLIRHAAGAARWKEAVTALADCLSRHPHLEITVRLPGAALEHVVREDPTLWGDLDRSRVRWLAGGYSDPVLTSLPPGAASLQLEREAVAMDTAGVTPAGLWAGDAWEPGLVSLAAEKTLPLVFLDASLLDGHPDRPGAVDRAGEAVIVVPVRESLPAPWPHDGLVAVRVAAEDLEDWVGSRSGPIVTPDDYLADHPPGERLAPPVTSPVRHPERETFYRKLLLLTRDQGDRTTGRDALLRLQSRENLLDGEAADGDRALIEARRTLDRARHRGDSWVEVRDVDWDADGLSEIWIETAEHTVVVDPAAGSFDVWDDKTLGWPIGEVAPPLSGVLSRRLTDDGQPPLPRMAVEGRIEGKAQASVTLSDVRGESCRLDVSGRTLTLELSVPPTGPVRLGPEIPLNFTGVRLRADGGDWVEATEPVAVAGHRFRLTDGERAMLIAVPRPCELFVRPLPGRGVVVWPHWMTRGGAAYRLAFTPS